MAQAAPPFHVRIIEMAFQSALRMAEMVFRIGLQLLSALIIALFNGLAAVVREYRTSQAKAARAQPRRRRNRQRSGRRHWQRR